MKEQKRMLSADSPGSAAAHVLLTQYRAGEPYPSPSHSRVLEEPPQVRLPGVTMLGRHLLS